MSLIGQEHMDRFYALAANASCISDPAEIFRQSRAPIFEMIPFDYFLIFFNDKLRECLCASCTCNTLPLPTQEEICIAYEDPLIQDILLSRQTLVRRTYKEPLLENVREELFVPLTAPEEVLGCLYFARLEPQAFHAGEIRLAELCSFVLANPMERIHWQKRAEQTHDILRTVREKYLSILDAIPYPAVVVHGHADRLEEVNRAFLDWSGYDRQTIFTRLWSEVCEARDQIEQEIWPPQAIPAAIHAADGRRVETNLFSCWLTTREPERRLMICISDWCESSPQASQKEAETLIRTLSHDLKAPLQSLKGFATLLREEYGYHLPLQAGSYVERMFVNIEQMEHLVTDLLDWSRLTQTEAVFEEVESSEILRNALDALSGLIEQRPINLIIDSALPQITCNVTQMTQVFTNLLSNALKFTRGVEIPSIEIGCDRHNGDFEFYITDNGSGIAPSDLAHIFDLFYTRDEDVENRSTGVGLTIVKRIIEQHHGRIWAESASQGGATIKFTLPRVLSRQASIIKE